jgi:hypothetical protein
MLSTLFFFSCAQAASPAPAAYSDKTNANARIRLQARFPILRCFFAKFGLARSPIKVSAT